MSALDFASTRPYLIRALHEWCSDNAFTPYIAVRVDETVQVPREYVQNGEIVLNVSFDATSALKLGNEYIEFKARFGGVPREIMVPVDRVLAIYARENGQGMAFPVQPAAAPPAEDAPAPAADAPEAASGRPGIQLVPVSESTDASGDAPEPSPPPKRPALKRIK
ncbi:MAG: ClpXP protease specificity-enhancing factor [Pseudomonadota bacterium]|nr:ClpXP protease specificity-enhancing factor [Pseudomonadota bacterium]